MKKISTIFYNSALWALFALVGGVALFYIPQLANPFINSKLFFVEYLTLFALVCFIIYFAIKGRFVLSKSRLFYFGLILLFLSGLSMIWAINQQLSFVELLFYLFLLALFLLFLQYRRYFRIFENVFFLSAAILSVVSILQFFYVPVFSDLGGYGKMRVYGLLGNPNYVGGFLTGIALLNLHRFILNRNNPIKYFLGLLFVVNALGLFVTFSRGSYLGFLAGLLLLLFIWRNKFLNIFSWIKSSSSIKILIAVMLVGLVAFQLSFFMSPLGDKSIDPAGNLANKVTVKGRLFITIVTLPMIRDHLWGGVGLGNYRMHYLDYQRKHFENHPNSRFLGNADDVYYAHNEYLHCWAENGIFSFIVLIGFLLGLYVIGFERIQKNKYIVGYLCALTAILTHSMSDFPLHIIPTQIFFVFLVAGIIGSVGTKRIIIKNQYLKYALFSILIIIVFALAIFVVRNFQAIGVV